MTPSPASLSPRHITFSVSAGSFPYQMGVAKYLQENFNLDENIHFSGASGGSWAALLLAAGIDMSYALNVLVNIGMITHIHVILLMTYSFIHCLSLIIIL